MKHDFFQILKKEQKSKSHKPKPRPVTSTVQEDSSQESVFPVVPLPKPCVSQQHHVPDKAKPKAVQIKKNQSKACAPKAAAPKLPSESSREFIPSGEIVYWLQRIITK